MSASQRDIVGRCLRGAARNSSWRSLFGQTSVGVTARRVRIAVARDIEDHQILRQSERTRIVLANFAFDLGRGVEVVEEMEHHGLARLYQSKTLPHSSGAVCAMVPMPIALFSG